ncbi:Pol [Symbiodinium sp. CCMP2456]|nr:Pol [Symbiodinium sp. CCMP2456]
MLDMGASFAAESRYRLSLAAGAFESAKKLLLQNPNIPIETRGKLFEATVSPTLFNLALWQPEGKQWQHLADGYSRQVRRLLGREIKGKSIFHLPTPVGHVITKCRPLEILAFRARVSLLLSLVKAAPPTLWGMLQEEGQWILQARRDLEKLVGKDEDKWPAVSSATWPEWWHLLKESPMKVKRAVARRMNSDFEAYQKKEIGNICLWALQRDLQQRQGTQDSTPRWSCRMCDKPFGTRAALGVHFFAVEFWSTARLEDHLRASKRCVDSMTAQGVQTGEVKPGYGSRHRRKESKEHYTPAPPKGLGSYVGVAAAADWNEWERTLYKDLSEDLLTDDFPDAKDYATSRIAKVINQYPLYPEEIDKVVQTLVEETQQVQQTVRQWSDGQYEAVGHGLLHVRRPPPEGNVQNIDNKISTYQEFKEQIDTFSWQRAIDGGDDDYGTPEKVFKLDVNWEAAWFSRSKTLSAAAVAEDLHTLLPPCLLDAWRQYLGGAKVRVSAPDSFWAHDLARPFVRFKALCKH